MSLDLEIKRQKAREATRRWRKRNPEKNRESNNTPKARAKRRQYARDQKLTPLGRARTLLYDIRLRCAKKELKYDLTPEWVAERIATGRCSVTGIEFRLNETKTAYVPSVDRIDPSKGYTMDNCQVVIMAYNTAKGNWSHDTVMEMARALCQRQTH